MTTQIPDLPTHQDRFHFNMTFAVTRDGFSTVINVSNYYNPVLFGEGSESAAVAELMFFDEEGRSRFRVFRELAPWSNLHFDVGEELRRQGQPSDTMGTVYSRLIPRKLPAVLKGKQVSTELTAEIVTPAGSRDFIHNTGGPAYVPTVSRYNGAALFADRFTGPCYFVLVNKYLGPRLPLVSNGFARLGITNHRGEKRRARMGSVPARGLRMFSLLDRIPDLAEFLDGECGRLDFHAANLGHKPWIWYGHSDGTSHISIDHT